MLERVELAVELVGQALELGQMSAELRQLRLPLLCVDAQQLRHVLVGHVHAGDVDALTTDRRDQADRRLAGRAVAGAARENPREHARVLAASTTTPTAGGDNLTITAEDASNNTVTSYAGSKGLTFAGASTIGPSTRP